MFMDGRGAESPAVSPVASGAVARLYTGTESAAHGGGGGSAAAASPALASSTARVETRDDGVEAGLLRDIPRGGAIAANRPTREQARVRDDERRGVAPAFATNA